MQDVSKSGRPSLRHILFSFVLILVISVVLIGGLVVIAAQSQRQIAIEDSVHLTRSVLAGIQRRLADQLLDYSYWDESVANLVTKPNLEWADHNVGIYMHDKFGIATSFVLDADDRPVYAMIGGKRSGVTPFSYFTGGLDKLLAMTRANPLTEPPKPATGLLFVGGTVHIAAASVITDFYPAGQPQAEIGTGSILVFTKALDATLLGEIAGNYLLDGLQVMPAENQALAPSVPLIGEDGSPLGHLTWSLESPSREMLNWLLPLLGAVMMVFTGITYFFLRKTQAVTSIMAGQIDEIQATQEALISAKSMADYANRAKTEFLANMSHDLRTPLNTIIGFSELIKDNVFGPIGNPKYEVYAKDIHQSGNHLLELINDILDISKIEIGEMALVEEPIDIGDLVKISMMMVRERSQRAKVSLSTEIPGGLALLHADQRRVKQVLLNLLTNAIKFTPPGGSVTLEAGLDGGGGIVIEVRDTGIGIAPGEIPKILETFGQGGDILTRSHEGTGLGLSLAKSLTEMHGGALSIASELNKGTKVTVSFPPARTLS